MKSKQSSDFLTSGKNLLKAPGQGFLSPQYATRSGLEERLHAFSVSQFDPSLYVKSDDTKPIGRALDNCTERAKEKQREKAEIVKMFKEMLSDKHGLIEFDSDGEMIEVDIDEQRRRRQLQSVKEKRQKLMGRKRVTRMQSSILRNLRLLTSGVRTKTARVTEVKDYLRSYKLPIFDKQYRVMSVRSRKRIMTSGSAPDFSTTIKLLVPGDKKEAVSSEIEMLPCSSQEPSVILHKILDAPRTRPKNKKMLLNIQKYINEPEKNARVLNEFKPHEPKFFKFSENSPQQYRLASKYRLPSRPQTEIPSTTKHKRY